MFIEHKGSLKYQRIDHVSCKKRNDTDLFRIFDLFMNCYLGRNMLSLLRRNKYLLFQ